MQNRPEEISADRSNESEGAGAADNLRSDAGLYRDNDATRNTDSNTSLSRENEHSILVSSKENSILVGNKEHSILVQSKEQNREHSLLVPGKEHSILVQNQVKSKEHSILVPSKEHSVLVPNKEHSILVKGKDNNSSINGLGNLTIENSSDKGGNKGSDWHAEEKLEPIPEAEGKAREKQLEDTSNKVAASALAALKDDPKAALKLAETIQALEQQGEKANGNNSQGRMALEILHCNPDAAVKAELTKNDTATTIQFSSKESDSSKNPFDKVAVSIDRKTGEVSLQSICKDGQASLPLSIKDLRQEAARRELPQISFWPN